MSGWAVLAFAVGACICGGVGGSVHGLTGSFFRGVLAFVATALVLALVVAAVAGAVS